MYLWNVHDFHCIDVEIVCNIRFSTSHSAPYRVKFQTDERFICIAACIKHDVGITHNLLVINPYLDYSVAPAVGVQLKIKHYFVPNVRAYSDVIQYSTLTSSLPCSNHTQTISIAYPPG